MLSAEVEGDSLVFVASGVVKLTAQSASPQPAKHDACTNHVLSFHFPTDIVSVLRREDGDFRLIALADAQLVTFSADRFLDLAQDDPAVIRSVLARSLNALHRSRNRMMQMSHKSARQRVADFLVSMSKRLTAGEHKACEFALPMSRRDIADCLGLTIETVSRQFAELRDAGLIETEGRSLVRLLDLEKLSREAGRTPLPHFEPTI